ncbi:MAG TPA: carboxypeptidase-like regulatory domain-containing protein [Planctomycetaceae bacterium]|nr:carboxypeptidase-like regulatory domain-containing protein [Planctomycetaceae bacterium]
MAKLLRKYTCLLLAGLLCVGTPVIAGEPAKICSSDVALNEGGLLRGTVLTTEAQPVAGITVHVLHEEKVVAKTTSDERGEFSVKGLRNGAHTVQIGSTRQSVRLWGTNSAPPAAVENVAIVVDDETVRGQNRMLPIAQPGTFLANNMGKLLLLGGAVAIVLGTTLDNGHDSPASP